MKITEFAVERVHGLYSVSIPIEDNRCVLVGVNGLGKTTVVNIFYFFLTRQWFRLLEYDFKRVSAKVDGQQISIDRSSIVQWTENSSRKDPVWHILEARLRRRPELFDLAKRADDDKDVLRAIAAEIDLPVSYIRQVVTKGIADSKFKDGEKIDKFLKDRLDGQFLYLPTYRRIERDLRSLFPALEKQMDELSEKRLRLHQEGHIELVEFGMRDVDRRLAEVFREIKDNAHRELNHLAASYLREVIRDELHQYDYSAIVNLDDDLISLILNRIQDRDLMSEHDIARLHAVIHKMKSSSSIDGGSQRYIAHFFGKLAEVHKKLSDQESLVAKFVDVSNSYLASSDKKLVFDDKNYRVSVELPMNRKGEFATLSSGEKQIVSLFAHLFLNRRKMFVLIDEPELSLSVDWQMRLLPDIWNSGKADFLLAVTHSPFVFDNDFDDYTADLRGLTRGGK